MPATQDTVYRIGSLTKQFTAALILLLTEEGRLSLNDELTRFLPDYPVQGHRVTARHLLDHTSGIRSMTAMGTRWSACMREDFAPKEMLEFFRDDPFDFAPGENYREALRGSLLDPLGLDHTDCEKTEQLVLNRARGYALTPDGLQIHVQEQPVRYGHGGGINGFTSTLAYYPEAEPHVAVLTNSGTANAGLIEVRVFVEDGQLMIRPTGQSAFRIRYQGEQRFSPTFSDGISVEFRLEQERVASIVLHQGGPPVTARRVGP